MRDQTMQPKVDTSLTNFVYAVVVGAAFQHIQLPLLSVANGMILLCFFVIVDDWVLYHFQVGALENKPTTFALCLSLDLGVLLFWYAAATKAQDGVAGVAGFAGLLCLFYSMTALWEWVFWRSTKTTARLTVDVRCAGYVGALALLYTFFPSWAGSSVVIWCVPLVALRAPVWRQLVLAEREQLRPSA